MMTDDRDIQALVLLVLGVFPLNAITQVVLKAQHFTGQSVNYLHSHRVNLLILCMAQLSATPVFLPLLIF